ncbi:hypothetical protein [Orrella daihaiensis]|uniref:Uncharacterized protein n=1 Tax=Orrella daihaiensis TaxID=2782176 RepID=A0ABY4ALA2_9BURK|nr:hypothetical protein [Orrella daihaiensis]UOD50426.1 hypothetical protein DHf2319_00310 [Orrella daihaiensis]
MQTVTFDISDRDYMLLSRLVELRASTITEDARELVLESRHTIPAQIHFLSTPYVGVAETAGT